MNCCAAPSGGFDYTGTTTFDLQPGDVYGFRMSGSHLDSDRRLIGTLSLTLPDPDVTPGCGDVAAAEGQEEFDLILEAAGDRKIQVIKVIREHTSLGLKETKDLVERAPTAVLEQVNKVMVERLTAALVAAGACVTIK